jgi:quinol-cytochrome oxidoreductase complex cytochrome b subunit
MQFIQIFIIFQVIFLFLQYFKRSSLQSFQYAELVFGSFFIIIFFGLFGSILTLDIIEPEPKLLNNSCLFASLFCIWFYLTKKITNSINSDRNGVIYF